MAQITFYEKPGCINNTKQKKWLQAAGHEVAAVNILEQDWSKETLKPFFGKKTIQECFNLTAPMIKSGELNPLDFGEDTGIEAMIQNPILIQRPLINIDETHFLQGFDKKKIDDLIGLGAAPGSEDIVSELEKTDLTTCPQIARDTSCDEIKANKNDRPIGRLMEIAATMGLQVTYAYDDLVFIEHNAFLFQFPETQGVNLYFNQECPEPERKKLFDTIKPLAESKKLTVSVQGTFEMNQKEGEEIQIEFFDYYPS